MEYQLREPAAVWSIHVAPPSFEVQMSPPKGAAPETHRAQAVSG